MQRKTLLLQTNKAKRGQLNYDIHLLLYLSIYTYRKFYQYSQFKITQGSEQLIWVSKTRGRYGVQWCKWYRKGRRVMKMRNHFITGNIIKISADVGLILTDKINPKVDICISKLRNACQ